MKEIKEKMIEIMKEQIESIGAITRADLFYDEPYSIERAVEDFLPLLELLGMKVPELGLEDISEYISKTQRAHHKQLDFEEAARKSKSIEELHAELDECIAGIKSSLGLSN